MNRGWLIFFAFVGVATLGCLMMAFDVLYEAGAVIAVAGLIASGITRYVIIP